MSGLPPEKRYVVMLQRESIFNEYRYVEVRGRSVAQACQRAKQLPSVHASWIRNYRRSRSSEPIAASCEEVEE